MPRDVRVFADIQALSLRAAEAAVATINDAVRNRGRSAIALAGGNTPRALYALMATTFRTKIPWASVHVFWSDERYVPPSDPRSNYLMAKDALLDRVPCPPANIHPMPTAFANADDAARQYEATMRDFFGGDAPRFDLLLLGLGDEGHTASLFPSSPALDEMTRWVLPVTAPADPPLRLTLTRPALAPSSHIYFLVAGASKARALRETLADNADTHACPAAAIQRSGNEVIWWVDRDAAGSPRTATAPPLDADGLPANPIAIAQDRIGANVNDSEVSVADELGRPTALPPGDERTLR